MRKNSFLIVSITALMALTACSNKSNGGNTNKSNNQSNSGASSLPDDFVPEAKQDAIITFNNVSETCMVTPKVKAYVDAMKAQEKTLEHPYRLSALYGPEDFAAMAGKSDQGDGVTYPEEETGGVDVCQYLSRNDYSNTIQNMPIKVSWSKGNLDYKRAYVKFWSKADESDAREVKADNTLTSASLPNLFRNTEYTYQVIADSETTRYTSQKVKFTTADYPRTITFGDIKNVRDVGGYMTSYGVRTNQGLIYRGYEIEDEAFTEGSNSHSANWSDAAAKVQSEVLKIGHELDLRADSGVNGRSESAIAKAGLPVDYTRATVIAYDSFINDANSTKSLETIFHVLAGADQKHVYFHCWGGADRTGMVAFFLNAILGVSYSDLIIDFELTTETNNKRCHMHNSSNAHFPKFIDAFTKYEGFDANKTINQNCEKFLLDKGVKAADIEKIRQNMLPGYTSNMKEVEPTYTADGEYQKDHFGHWKVAKENPLVKCDYHRHTLVEDASRPSVESNCHEHGMSYQICSVCGETVETELPLTDHNWIDGEKTTNSEGKEVINVECFICHEKGAKMSVNDYSSAEFDSDDDKALDNIRPKQKEPITYKIVVHEAGDYAISMGMKNVKNGDKKMSSRSFKINVNDVAATMVSYGDATADDLGINADTITQVDLASSATFTQGENVISLTCSGYRLIYSGYLIVTKLAA